MKSKSAFRLVHSGSPAACVFASAIAALLATPAVRATDFAWDPANDAAGGSNTWDASSSLWDSGTTPTAGNTNILWSNGAANQAFFAGAAGIVTLGTSISAGTLTFSSAGYQINTGINTLTLNSANTLTVTNSNVYGLEFVGATTLTAAPTFSVANASASNVVKGLVLTGPVTGAAGLTKSGTGMLQLNASAVLLGTLDVTGGGLHIGAAGAGARLADVVLENGTRLNLNGNAALFGSLTTPVSGSGMVTNTGALATLTVDNSSPAVNRLASAGVTLSGGTLNATGGDADESGSALTANLGLDTIVTGANTLVTAYSAYTTGDLGTTGASPDNFEPTGTQTHLTAGKTINSLNLTLQGGIAEGVTLNSGQTLTLGAGSSINNGSGNITGGILTTTGNAELSANYATGGSIGSIISGTSGGLTKLGAGNLTLSSPESFSGQTTVNQGTLTLAGGNNTLAVNNALRVNYGGTLDLGANNQYVNTLASAGTVEGSGGSIIGSGRLTTNAASGTFAGNIGGSVSLVKAGANTLTLPSATTTTGTLSVIGGGLTLKDGGTLAGLTGTPAINLNYATLTLDNTGFKDLGSRVKDDAPITMNGGTGGFQVDTTGQTLTLTGLIDGGGSLVKTGPGTLTLGGNNTYGGATTVNTGTLKAGVASVADGSGAFGLNSPITPATYAGVLSGTGMLTKIGTATQILTGSNTYSGATTVNGGSLLINGSNTGAGTVNVGVNGTLGGIGTIAGAVNVSGTLAPGASIGALTSGDLTFADNSTFRYQLNSSVPHATGAALQIVNGVLNFGSSVALLLTDLGTGSLSGGTVFSLLNYSGAWNNGLLSFGATPLADDSTYTALGKSWTIDYNATLKGENVAAAEAGHYVNITLAGASAYQTWIKDPAFGITDPAKQAPLADADNDGISNVTEFAFDPTPNNGASGPEALMLSPVLIHGQPILARFFGHDNAVFGRRADRVSAGLTYTVQFSKDLVNRETSGDTPIPIGSSDATIEVVPVPYPITIFSGTQTPKFFRVLVTLAD